MDICFSIYIVILNNENANSFKEQIESEAVDNNYISKPMQKSILELYDVDLQEFSNIFFFETDIFSSRITLLNNQVYSHKFILTTYG